MTDAERFRAQGHAAIDLLADHLAAAAAGEGPVLPPGDPAALCALFPPDFPATAPPEDPVPGLLKRVLDRGFRSIIVPMVNSADEAAAIVGAMAERNWTVPAYSLGFRNFGKIPRT